MPQDRAAGIRISRIGEEGFAVLRGKWNCLLSQSGADNIFLSWEWLRFWWDAYREESFNLCILLVFRGDDLIGIGPFYIKRQPVAPGLAVRRLFFLGTIENDAISEYMDFIYAPQEAQTVVPALLKFILEERLCDDMSLHKIDMDSPSLPLIRQSSRQFSDGQRPLFLLREAYESPYIELPGNPPGKDGDFFMSGPCAPLRDKIRRNRRKLARYPDAAIRRTADIAGLGRDFNELVRLHHARWEGRGLPGSFSDARFIGFHRAVMPVLLESGYLDLWFLRAAGKCIGALYNISYNGQVFYYQGGIDTAFDRGLAPGYLLHSHCIEDAIGRGMKRYDFLAMGALDSYKKQWTRTFRRVCDVYLAVSGMMKLFTGARERAKAVIGRKGPAGEKTRL
ncbi:MAG: GNAT family N-acetyltransferase [Nitrospiraceae bacterium]|nr:GNAT family N-acetyltransferase [Nitrospiraceae bacterium]